MLPHFSSLVAAQLQRLLRAIEFGGKLRETESRREHNFSARFCLSDTKYLLFLLLPNFFRFLTHLFFYPSLTLPSLFFFIYSTLLCLPSSPLLSLFACSPSLLAVLLVCRPCPKASSLKTTDAEDTHSRSINTLGYRNKLNVLQRNPALRERLSSTQQKQEVQNGAVSST